VTPGLRALQLLLGVGHLRASADHVGDLVQRRQLGVRRRPVTGARLLEGCLLRFGAILQLLGIELDERLARRYAIAEVVGQAGDAAFDLGADHDFLARRQRADHVHLAPDIVHLRRLDHHASRLRLGGLRTAIARTPGRQRGH